MSKPDFQADDAVEFWDTTNREDWAKSRSFHSRDSRFVCVQTRSLHQM